MSEPTILVVDDQENPRKSLVIYLKENTPYKILEAADGYQTLEILKNETVDMVLLDINMPGISGREVIEQAKEMNKDLKMTVLSGWDSDEIAEEVKTLGADHFINKPYQPEFIKKHIEQNL